MTDVSVSDYPRIVVVRLSRRRWKLARIACVEQVDNGPVVVTYAVVEGLPYVRDGAAAGDARLVLQGSEARP